MVRIIADSNILLSSIFWSGNPYKIIQKAINNEILIFISQPILDEIKIILKRDFRIGEQEIMDIIDSIKLFTQLVKPKEKIDFIKEDRKDNIILECAVAANAKYIVSGDNHLKDLVSFRNIKIVSPAEFLRIIDLN